MATPKEPPKYDNPIQEQWGRPNAAWVAWDQKYGSGAPARAGAPTNLNIASPAPVGPGGAAGGGTSTGGGAPSGSMNYPPGYQLGGTNSAQPGTTTPGTTTTNNNNPFANMTPAQIQAYIQSQAAALAAKAAGSSSSGSAAADLQERRREFDVTTQRDIAKENASEVNALQKMIGGMSGPKDVYGDLFFSHGLAAPQGYKPAPIPLTQAQIGAYKAMGVSAGALQQMLTGGGKPGADTGMLGNLGSSLQPQPGTPGFAPAQAPVGAQQASNPTAQGGQLYGKAPAGTTVTNTAPQTPGGVPSMAVGGMVPDQNAAPPDAGPSSGGLKSMLPPGLHPAIANLVDAVSNLLSNPDFRPFVEDSAPPHDGGAPVLAMLHGGEEVTPADEVEDRPERPESPETPGGVQSMATGGTVTSPSGTNLNPAPPLKPSPVPQTAGGTPLVQGTSYSPPSIPGGSPPPSTPGFSAPTVPTGAAVPSGAPQGGAQGVIYNTGQNLPKDNPIIPLAKMDPYTRALYDIHGRLHPYSAQQQMQMGPQGTGAVSSYIGKVQGGDVNAYQDLVDRLKPIGAAPTASTGSASAGFSFG